MRYKEKRIDITVALTPLFLPSQWPYPRTLFPLFLSHSQFPPLHFPLPPFLQVSHRPFLVGRVKITSTCQETVILISFQHFFADNLASNFLASLVDLDCS